MATPVYLRLVFGADKFIDDDGTEYIRDGHSVATSPDRVKALPTILVFEEVSPEERNAEKAADKVAEREAAESAGAVEQEKIRSKLWPGEYGPPAESPSVPTPTPKSAPTVIRKVGSTQDD